MVAELARLAKDEFASAEMARKAGVSAALLAAHRVFGGSRGAAYLASAEADYITGATLVIDGGLLWNYAEQ